MLTGDFSKAWISIHALLAESDRLCAASIRHRPISIHALLAESDGDWLDTWDSGDISIHALLAESDRFLQRRLTGCAKFLSTLSLRRATLKALYAQLF